MTTAIDPFATMPASATAGEDPFATPRTTFPKPKWLKGRLVLAYPTKILRDQLSKDGTGKKYNAIVADVHVLDGGDITDGPDKPISIPAIIEDFRFSNEQFVGGMERLIGSHRPFLFRMGYGPSKMNAEVPAFWPDLPSEADKTRAKQYMAGKGLL